MKNYTIPAILVVAIIAAGAFAFAPIEKATAVHDTIIDTITINIAANSAKVFTVADADLNNGDFITLDCNADYLLQGITLDVGPGTYLVGGQDDFDVTIGGDDIATSIALIADSAVAVLDGQEAADVNEDTILTFFLGNDDDDEDIEQLRISVVTSGDCSLLLTP